MAPAQHTAVTQHQLSSQPVNAFEAERARIMARNRQKLEQMGVIEAVGQLHTMMVPQSGRPKYTANKKRPRPVAAAEPDAPQRASRRIRGMAVDAASVQAVGDDVAATNSSGSPMQQSSSTPAPAGPKQPAFELVPNTQYVTPFTIASIGVTVWDLGELHRGPWQQNYWSSKGCKYHHAYPVGYVASKHVFNRTWRMTITAGERGPVFTVSDDSGRFKFSGNSPTKPWTDVCLAQRTGQRISGPQYYGFSDALVQRAIATMYTPHELECAQYGTPLCRAASQQPSADASGHSTTTAPPQQHLTPVEQFAHELECSVRGIGTTTAAVIATTKALGGTQHSSLESFKAWLKADDMHVQHLTNFLLNSPEMPNGSRHLPSWRNKWVPMILLQLTQTNAVSN